MKNLIPKKTTILALIILIVFGFLLFSPHVGLATEGSGGQAPESSPSIFSDFADIVAWLVNIVLALFGLILFLVSKVFELAIKISLNPWYGDMKVVTNAWILCRDVVNAVFIFILLYISLATVLKLSSGTIKQLLMKTLVMAVLVNFSLTATKIMIDASNVLAVEFYNKISTNVNVEVATFTFNEGITAHLLKGMQLQTLFNKVEGEKVTLLLITGLLGSILMLSVSVVLLMGGLLFITRTITLIFLMILSPFAFVASVIPAGSAKQISTKWWSKLTNQLLFAPTFMFLLYLTVSIIEANEISTGMKTASGSSAAASTDFAAAIGSMSTGFTSGNATADAALLLFMNFFVAIGLLSGTIIISKQLGAAGADWATGQATKLQNKAKGLAIGAAAGTAGFIAGGARRASSAALRAKPVTDARGMTTTRGDRLAGKIGAIPLVGTAAARGVLSAQRSQERANAEKIRAQAALYAGKPQDDLVKLLKTSGLASDKAAILGELAKKPGGLKGVDSEMMKAGVESMMKGGMRVEALSIAKLNPEEFGGEGKGFSTEDLYKAIKPADLASMDPSVFTKRGKDGKDTFQQAFFDGLFANGGDQNHIAAAIANGGKASEMLLSYMKGEKGDDTTTEELARKFSHNIPLKTWIENNKTAPQMLGIKDSKEIAKKAAEEKSSSGSQPPQPTVTLAGERGTVRPRGESEPIRSQRAGGAVAQGGGAPRAQAGATATMQMKSAPVTSTIAPATASSRGEKVKPAQAQVAREDQYAKVAPEELTKTFSSEKTSSQERADVLRSLANREGGLDKLGEDDKSTERFLNTVSGMQNRGEDITDIAKLNPSLYGQFAMSGVDKTKLMEAIKPSDIASGKLHKSAASQSFVKEYIDKHATPETLKAMMAHKGDLGKATTAYTSKLKTTPEGAKHRLAAHLFS